jgi:RNA ligase
VEPQAELLLFNYTARATYENTWNAVEVVSRGLIVHWPSAQLAALPFPKFFNVGQRPETAIDMLGAHPSPVEVTSKLDGSLGILYRPPDGFAIATRGSFTSTQALWATQHLRARYDLSALPDDVTLLFEIVYPDNPEGPILRYGETADLFLIGARRFDGRDATYGELRTLSDQFGFPLTPLDAEGDHFEHVGRLVERGATEQGIEGWVVRFADGFRVKVKTSEYLALARLVSHLTPGHVRDLLMNDPAALESYILLLPDEFQREGRRLANAITAQYDAELARLEQNLAEIVSETGSDDRKAFAAAVLAKYPADAKYLFALHDDKGIRPLILRRLDLTALEATTPKYGEDG